MLQSYLGIVRSRIVCLGLSGSALLLVGCAPSGSRAGQGGEYTRYVMSLYNDPASPHGLRTIEFPINIAAAQIGRTAPEPAVLDKLQQSRDVFGRVESLPAEEDADKISRSTVEAACQPGTTPRIAWGNTLTCNLSGLTTPVKRNKE